MPSERADYRELIPEVRQQVLDRCDRKPELYDEEDVQRVTQIDWWCLRYIKWNVGDVDKSVQQLDETLKWRKEFGVNARSEADVPNEFVRAGAIFSHGMDDSGRQLIYLRVKVYKKLPQLMEYFRQFVVAVIDKVDNQSLHVGYGLVFDLTGVGFSNVDMDFLKYLITIWRNYFPCGLRYVIVNNLPRLLRPLWSVAKLWVGSQEKLIKFANGDEIKEYIPIKQLPLYLGGEAQFDFTVPPNGCKSVHELGPKYGFTEKEVEKYMKMFEPHIKEAEQLVRALK